MISLRRHELGPRVYLLGHRIHEWHLGLAVGLATAIVSVGGLLHPREVVISALVGAWLVAKDWRDILPATRDTTAWRLGLHTRVTRLRTSRRGDRVPAVAAAAVAVAGLVNLGSTLTPDIAGRAHFLHRVEPVVAIPLLHAVALPVSGALVLTAFYLARRRRRAWQAATTFLVLLGALDVLKGLDVEEALLSWAVAALLWWGREAFYVRHNPVRLRTAAVLTPSLATGLFGLGLAAALAASPDAGPAVAFREALGLVTWSGTAGQFRDELSWLPFGLGLASGLALAAAAYAVFRPLAAPRALPDPETRRAAAALVARHGTDTLAYFKLRRDANYLFSSDRRAFVGYRVESGVLLVSGDPVGPPDALPNLIRELCRFAEMHGLELAALGVSDTLLPLWREAGLRGLYIGDEAIVETRTFTLEGRAMRKVRQSVTRLERAGYRVELVPARELSPSMLHELDRVSSIWRSGTPERGFTMAMDSLHEETAVGGMTVLARDRQEAVRGFIHFVPSAGRPAMSLSLMRRDRSTPNGLMEFLVAGAVELLLERGVEEISLNFAAFARLLHSPRNSAERLLGRVVALADSRFQIESLYRFNAKFFPRWEPRYLVFDKARYLPRVGLAAMWIEGQLHKPALRQPGAAAA